jgi:hypothetical protein
MTTTTNPTILASGEYAAGSAPLPSWNEGSTKKSILDFVRGVTTAGGQHFVKPEDRIAVFDNDGTLWSEQPFYFQFAFALDRMKAMAPQHPEWKDNPLYAAAVAGDMKTVAAGGIKGVLELATVTHAGMTTDEFAKIVEDWIASAASQVRPSLRGGDLSADVGVTRLFASQWLQDFYRLWRGESNSCASLRKRSMGYRRSR